jgi:hypothetical protein
LTFVATVIQGEVIAGPYRYIALDTHQPGAVACSIHQPGSKATVVV